MQRFFFFGWGGGGGGQGVVGAVKIANMIYSPGANVFPWAF